MFTTLIFFFYFNDTATTEIYTLSLHDALPISAIPRLSVYVHKFNFSHDLIFETRRFVLHLLRTDQFELIHALGFVSGRTRDKLAAVPHTLGALGAPVLDDCYAHFECRVINVMD